MGLDLDKLDKEAHERLYRLFCSSWIHSGGAHTMPPTGDRYILDQILANGKITPSEALKMENEMRELIPEFWEVIAAVEENCSCQETKH